MCGMDTLRDCSPMPGFWGAESGTSRCKPLVRNSLHSGASQHQKVNLKSCKTQASAFCQRVKPATILLPGIALTLQFSYLGPRARALLAPGCPRSRRARARGPRAATRQLPGIPRVATIQLPSIALQAIEDNCISSSHKKAPPKPCFRAPLHGIDTQGSYNSVTRYSTSSSLSVSRSITSTHVQQSTALKSHSCFELMWKKV